MKVAGILWGLVLAAIVLLAGCGGSDNNYWLLGQGKKIQGDQGLNVTNFQPASVVIGQATFTAYSSSGVGIEGNRPVAAYTIDEPYGDSAFGNGIFYVPDYGSNRVLGFSGIPATNGASAAFVLGQSNVFSSGSGTGAGQMNGPLTARYANGKLLVADYANSRVLIWNTAPTTSGAPADVVVGQTGFGSGGGGASQTQLYEPEDMIVVGNKLIVADTGNNRVLIWNSIPTTNGAPADVVLGQNDFTHKTANDDNQDGIYDTTPTARTLSFPVGLWSDGTRLIVCDAENNRVLIWNTIPTSNFAPANLVLGQSDFTHFAYNDDNQDGTADATPTARTFNLPYFVTSNGTQFFVVDYYNNRVLMWNSIPTANFTPADRVLGQGDFTHNAANDDNQDGTTDAAPTGRTLFYPSGIFIYGNQLFVMDASNNRLLIFDF